MFVRPPRPGQRGAAAPSRGRAADACSDRLSRLSADASRRGHEHVSSCDTACRPRPPSHGAHLYVEHGPARGGGKRSAVMPHWGWSALPRFAASLRHIAPDAILLMYIGWIYDSHPMVTFAPTVARKLLPSVPFVTRFENTSASLPGANSPLRPRRSPRRRPLRRHPQRRLQLRHSPPRQSRADRA